MDNIDFKCLEESIDLNKMDMEDADLKNLFSKEELDELELLQVNYN